MPAVEVTIQHGEGLHARPASLFVKTAAQFRSEIFVTHNNRTANAKSILNVLTLGAGQGARVTLSAEGEDADQALHTLEQMILDNFGEPK